MKTELLDSSRGMKWAKLDLARIQKELKLFRTVRALFADFEREVLRRLAKEELAARSRVQLNAELLQRLTEAAFRTDEWAAALQTSARSTMLTSAGMAVDELPVDLDDLLESNQRWIKTRSLNSIRSIKGTQIAALEGILAENFATEGATVADLTREIGSHFKGMKAWQARRIAVTESAAFWNRGAEQAILASGLRKQWLSARDDLVRPTHVEADGQTVEANADFVVGEGTGPHPGALSDEGENINCRCVVVAVS